MSLYNWGYLCLMLCVLFVVISTTIADGNWMLAIGLGGGLLGVLSGGLFGLAGSRDIRK
jgi:hypothetical protein